MTEVNDRQATVKKGSDIVGANIRDLNFRSRFNAAVLAVKRGPKHQPGRLGDVVVEAGDVLVILAGAYSTNYIHSAKALVKLL